MKTKHSTSSDANEEPEEKSKSSTSSEANEESRTSYFGKRAKINEESKRKVAAWVVKNILKEGDSILLDAGSSLFPVADEILQRSVQSPEETHYTIITHNYRAFGSLFKVPGSAMINIVLAGGRFDHDLNAMFGPQTVMSYDSFFPRVVLLGVSGLVADLGLFCHGNTEELIVKETIFRKKARDRIIVADYTKLGTTDALRFGTSDHLRANVDHCIVVTDKPDRDEERSIRDKFETEVERLRTYAEVQFVE